jgi:hypothetical protein
MKTLIILTFLLFSSITQASLLGGIIVGAALSSNKTIVKSQTDNQKLIESLNNSIPLAKYVPRNHYLNFSKDSQPAIDDDNWG